MSAHQPKRRQARPRPGSGLRNLRAKPANIRYQGANPLKSALWTRLKREMLVPGARCHLCGCPNPDSLDHLKSRTEHPELALERSNLRPVHHKPCPFCSQKAGIPIWCNNIRGGYSVERGQQIIKARVEAGLAKRLEIFGDDHIVVEAEDVPRGAPLRNGAQHPSGKFFRTVLEAQQGTEPTVPNYNWLWAHAYDLACPHAPAGVFSEGRCWECLPSSMDPKWRDRLKAYEAEHPEAA